MASHNEITGDALVSRQANENYRSNYDRIFGKKKENKDVGEDQLAATNGTSVSVSVVSSAGCTGSVGGLREVESTARSGEEN